MTTPNGQLLRAARALALPDKGRPSVAFTHWPIATSWAEVLPLDLAFPQGVEPDMVTARLDDLGALQQGLLCYTLLVVYHHWQRTLTRLAQLRGELDPVPGAARAPPRAAGGGGSEEEDEESAGLSSSSSISWQLALVQRLDQVIDVLHPELAEAVVDGAYCLSLARRVHERLLKEEPKPTALHAFVNYVQQPSLPVFLVCSACGRLPVSFGLQCVWCHLQTAPVTDRVNVVRCDTSERMTDFLSGLMTRLHLVN